MRLSTLSICKYYLLTFLLIISYCPAQATETWESLDKHLKNEVFQLNVGLKLKLKNSLWIQLADLSPKYRYPVFSTTKEDRGYRVVGFGSSFPLVTNNDSNHPENLTSKYFITNKHVVESGTEIIKECERFYAALELYAEQTTAGHNVDTRYSELLQIINLAEKKDLNLAERTLYQSTADAIWDCYETYLSKQADPARALFKKYLSTAELISQTSYFLHQAGPVTQASIEAKLYKIAKSDSDPDLAILTTATTFSGIELDLTPPSEGQEIQVIGYPTASDQIDQDSAKYYAPTFSSGRISRIAPRILQVDAPITTGNSGGPVISLRGKVVGVVAVRAISARGGELPNFGGAVTASSVKAFAPELFESAH